MDGEELKVTANRFKLDLTRVLSSSPSLSVFAAVSRV